MIAHADTVVNPRAVMVESFHAHVADGAVARAGCADDLAVGAEVGRHEPLQEVQEVQLRAGCQLARVSRAGKDVGDDDQEGERARWHGEEEVVVV